MCVGTVTWKINADKRMPKLVPCCCEPGFRYDRVCVSILISVCPFSFYITRLSSAFLFFPPSPVFFRLLLSGRWTWSSRSSEQRPAVPQHPLQWDFILCSHFDVCDACSLRFWLFNKLISLKPSTLLYYSFLSCLFISPLPLPGALFRSFRVSSSRAF